MTEIKLQLGGQSIAFVVTDYHPGRPATWHEPEELPEIEWHAESAQVDAVIDEFGIADEVEERLLEACRNGKASRQQDEQVERAAMRSLMESQ